MRTDVLGERGPSSGQSQENEAATCIYMKRLEPGVFPVEGSEAASVGNPGYLSRRGILPAVVLAGEFATVAPGQFGQQAMPVGADV